MSRTVIWLLGLIALALLLFFCIRNHTPDIQEDILTRTSSTLSAAPTDWANVSVDGRDVILTGVAPSEALREKAGGIAKDVWGVVSVDNQLTVAQSVPEIVVEPEPVVTYSPYESQFVKNGSSVVLTGSVPDEEQLKAIVKLAEEKFGAGNVTNQLQIKSGAPADWQQVAALAITNLALFNEGTASLVDTNISLSGRVFDGQAKSNIEASLQNLLPNSFNSTINLTVRQPVAEEVHHGSGAFCAKQFSKNIAGRVVHFITDSAGVKAQVQSIFDDILQFSSSCPNSIIEVAGHTDSRGSSSYNLSLSNKRAEAIMNKLIDRGMRADRLRAIGYGEESPLSDNYSKEGQANNRRIEFNYLQEGE